MSSIEAPRAKHREINFHYWNRLRLFMGAIALSTVLVSCSDKADDVSFVVGATVSVLHDINNPLHGSDDPLFPTIPHFQAGEREKHISVSRRGYFEVSCAAKERLAGKVIEEDTMAELSEDSAYVYFKSESGSYVLDRRKAIKVDRAQYENRRINQIFVKVDEDVVKVSEASNKDSSLLSEKEMINASRYAVGEHKIVCVFNTRDKKRYEDSATVEIYDDRS